MKKKLLAGFLVFTMCLGLLPTVALSAEPMMDNAGAEQQEELPAIPEETPEERAELAATYDMTYDVTGGKLYFDSTTGTITDCDISVTKANIPSTIGGVGVTSIGENAFLYCSKLISVTIPGSVTSIGGWAFYNCTGLTGITIPDSVTSIEQYAFYDCTGLASITIPNNVTSIGGKAFYGCTGLTDVTIPDNVTSIGSDAFSGCTGLKAAGPMGSECNIRLGWTKEIPAYAFTGFADLTSITIPDSVTSIGMSAFSGCAGLTSVTIPGSVTSIDYNAFSGCTGLTSITIPDGVTSIGYGAFYGCSSLTNVTIPGSVTSIGNIAFYGCSGLKTAGPIGSGCNIQFGWTKEIPASAFSGSSDLTSVTIPDTVTNIGDGAFSNCDKLTSIDIPASVIRMGNNFSNCDALTAINVDPNNRIYSSSDGALLSKEGNVLQLCPRGKTSYVIPNTVQTIAESAFADCSRLTSVTIPDSVTSIGNNAFYGCSSLAEVTIPSSVVTIGSGWSANAFSNCTGLKTVSILGPASIGGSAFYGCTALTEISMPYVTYIDRSAFSGCTGLTSVTNPGSVTNIGTWAFSNCTGLKSVSIAEGVETLGDSLFNGCSALEEISIPLSVTKIYSGAFKNCTSLKTINYAGNETQWGQIDTTTDNQELSLATINFGATAEPTPPTEPVTPDLLPLSCTPGGLGYKVTLTVDAGHWLTVQTRRAGSIALTALKVPGSDGDATQVTLSASAGSVIQAWETQEEMTFTNGVPDNVILSTVIRDLSAQAQLLSSEMKEAARPASLLQTAGTQTLGEVGGDSISVTMNDLTPNGYYLGAVWDEGQLLALFDGTADENGAFSGEVEIGTKVEAGIDYRVGVSTANAGGGEPIKSQVEQTGGSCVTVARNGSTVVVSDPEAKLSTCETVIAARYSDQGQMLDVVTASYGGSGMSLDFSKTPESTYRWRFFFLNSQSEPLCERVFLTK